MSHRHVGRKVVELLVNLADRCGVPLDELSRGLSVDEDMLRRRVPIDWNDFAAMIERLATLTGYKPLESVVSHVPDIAPALRTLLSGFVSPRVLYRFVNSRLGPVMYPMFHSTYEERGNRGCLRIELRDASLDDCPAFFRLMQPGQASVACFIGYPALPTEATTTARGGVFRYTLPPAETLIARAQRRLNSIFWREALREFEEDKARLLEANEQLWRSRRHDVATRLEAASRKWSLTRRQGEVLAGLARGLSNKELAAELGCSLRTVESHIAELLERTSSESRLQLVVLFWREL